jgi:hypothetical protein
LVPLGAFFIFSPGIALIVAIVLLVFKGCVQKYYR